MLARADSVPGSSHTIKAISQPAKIARIRTLPNPAPVRDVPISARQTAHPADAPIANRSSSCFGSTHVVMVPWLA